MTDQKQLTLANEFTVIVAARLNTEQRQQLSKYLNKDAVHKIYAENHFKVKLVYDVNGDCKMELL
jgi:hypothetical protein